MSKNNFPSDAGIAASASSFSALTSALLVAFGMKEKFDDKEELSRQIRLCGSSSAIRSAYGGFVELVAGKGHKDTVAVQIADKNHWNLVDVVVVVNPERKIVSSSRGHILADTSPYFETRIKEMKKRIKFVEKNGGNYIMLDILTLGWSALQTARDYTKLPIHAHRAGHAMLDRTPNHGMSMEVIAQLARMVGVDTLHIGTAYGKMTGGKDEVLHIEQEMEQQYTVATKTYLGQKWPGVKPVFGVASGGVYPGMVPAIIKFMGNDVVIQAGGGVHGNPGGTEAGARAMRQAVDATLKNISLTKYAEDHEELEQALEKWGMR